MPEKKQGKIRKAFRRTVQGLAIIGAGTVAYHGVKTYPAAKKWAKDTIAAMRKIPGAEHAKNFRDLRLPNGKPSISASTINRILAKTPIAGRGKLIFQMAQKYNVDPAFALGFWRQESEFCSRGLGRKNNNPGNIKVVKISRDKKGNVKKRIEFGKFESIEQGIEAWFKLIARDKNYYRGERYTLEEIVRVYAPRADKNNPETYIANVMEAVKKYKAMEKWLCRNPL